MPPDPDPNAPKDPFSPEQTQFITDLLGRTVNNMLTARLSTSETKITEKVVAAVGKSLDEKLAAFKPEPPPADDKGGKGGKKDDVETATLKRRIDELERTTRESNERAAAAKAQTRAVQLRQRTYEALAANGIDSEMHKEGAFAALKVADRIKYRDDDSDELIFVDDTGVELELGQGLRDWAKTAQAKIYIPARSANGGSGGKPPPSPNGPPAPPKTKEERETVAWTALGNSLRDAFGGMSGPL